MYGAVARVEVHQLELSLQLFSLQFRSAALEEALAVASPGSAACLGRLLASWLERACSVRVLSQVAESIPVFMGGRSAMSVLPLCSPLTVQAVFVTAPLRLFCGIF